MINKNLQKLFWVPNNMTRMLPDKWMTEEDNLKNCQLKFLIKNLT